MVPAHLIEPIERIVADLAEARFALLERDGRAGRLSADELGRALAAYGRTLVPLPDGWERSVEVYASHGSQAVRSLDLTLWTAEEGRSDLTLQLEVRLANDGTAVVAIEDLRVL